MDPHNLCSQATAFSLPSGKLDLYVAAAGFEASETLPCVLDMGTNNMDLRTDPTYMGLDQDRLDGDKFYEVQPSTHSLTALCLLCIMPYVYVNAAYAQHDGRLSTFDAMTQ